MFSYKNVKCARSKFIVCCLGYCPSAGNFPLIHDLLNRKKIGISNHTYLDCQKLQIKVQSVLSKFIHLNIMKNVKKSNLIIFSLNHCCFPNHILGCISY